MFVHLCGRTHSVLEPVSLVRKLEVFAEKKNILKDYEKMLQKLLFLVTLYRFVTRSITLKESLGLSPKKLTILTN